MAEVKREQSTLYYYATMAKEQFPGVKLLKMIMALTIFVKPGEGWDGLVLYEGVAPKLGPKLVCLTAEGFGAGRMIRNLGRELESRGIAVWNIADEPAEKKRPLAEVRDGHWFEAEPK